MLAETVTSLQDELAAKNNQIERLHNLLSQQQQLNLQSNKQVEHLQLEAKGTEEEVSEEKNRAFGVYYSINKNKRKSY